MRRVIIASTLMLLATSLIPETVAQGAALPGKINLGWRFGNGYCDCAIGDLTVHGQALTAAEVAQWYAR